MKEFDAIIIGFGKGGKTLATELAQHGWKVAVIERSDKMYGGTCINTGCIPTKALIHQAELATQKKGFRFILNANVQSVTNVEKGTTITYKDTTSSELNTLKADAILLATGRKPNTENLNLKAAGVEVNERGAIIADEHLKTTTPHIRVIGDVKGGLQFTYVSLDDYRIIREDLFGNKDRMTTDREPISYSVFIDPPLSRIGMSEEDAKKKNLNFKVNKFTVSSIPRVHTIGKTEGMLKAIIDADTKKILGCTLFCPESSEIINIVAIAMKTGQDYTFLRDFIFTHPSISESFNDLFKFKL